eukprot:EG_transcript_20402
MLRPGHAHPPPGPPKRPEEQAPKKAADDSTQSGNDAVGRASSSRLALVGSAAREVNPAAMAAASYRLTAPWRPRAARPFSAQDAPRPSYALDHILRDHDDLVLHMESEVAALRGYLDRALLDKTNAQIELQHTAQARDMLAQSVQRLGDDNHVLMQQVSHLRKDNDQTRMDVFATRCQLAQAEEQVRQLLAVQTENAALRVELRAVEAELAEERRHGQRCGEQLQQSEAHLAAAEVQQGVVQDMQHIVDRLTGEVAKEQAAKALAQAERDALARRVAELEVEAARLREDADGYRDLSQQGLALIEEN